MNQEPMQAGPAKPGRAARLRWPLIVVGLLSAHVSAMALAVHVAKGDPGAGNGNRVLPDYYERAVRWDEERQEAEASAALGWRVLPSVSAFVAADGTRDLSVSVNDAEGAPVTGLELRAAVWHHAFGEATEVALRPVQGVAGLYAARAPMAADGDWEVEVDDDAEGGILKRAFTLSVGAPR